MNLYLHHQLTQEEWDIIMDRTKPFGVRLGTLCNRSQKVGCVWPTEFTEVHMVAILQLAMHGRDADSLEFDPSVCLQTLGHIKTSMKNMRRFVYPHYGARVRNNPHPPSCGHYGGQVWISITKPRIYPPRVREILTELPQVALSCGVSGSLCDLQTGPPHAYVGRSTDLIQIRVSDAWPKLRRVA